MGPSPNGRGKKQTKERKKKKGEAISNRKTVHPWYVHFARSSRCPLVQISIGFHIPVMNEPRLDWLQLWNVYGWKQKPEGGPLTPAVNSGRRGTTKVWWGTGAPRNQQSQFHCFLTSDQVNRTRTVNECNNNVNEKVYTGECFVISIELAQF